jgi:predicted metal-dependent hydrolase
MKTNIRRQTYLDLRDRRIPYSVHNSARQSVRIVITHDASITVYAPRYYADDEITHFVRNKAAWIIKTLNKINAYQPLLKPREYTHGETVAYLGKKYRLNFNKGKRTDVFLDGDLLSVNINTHASTEDIQTIVDDWYYRQASETFESLLNHWYTITFQDLVTKPRMTIRRMRSRWGSCSATGRVSLNLDLIYTPMECIEYVIVHELCHLIHHNHSRDFYQLLSRIHPDWRQHKMLLDRFRIT